MCRWLAYSGSPVLLEELLLKPEHSLIDQSLHSKFGATTTNGDGIGIGWYGEGVIEILRGIAVNLPLLSRPANRGRVTSGLSGCGRQSTRQTFFEALARIGEPRLCCAGFFNAFHGTAIKLYDNSFLKEGERRRFT